MQDKDPGNARSEGWRIHGKSDAKCSNGSTKYVQERSVFDFNFQIHSLFDIILDIALKDEECGVSSLG